MFDGMFKNHDLKPGLSILYLNDMKLCNSITFLTTNKYSCNF